MEGRYAHKETIIVDTSKIYGLKTNIKKLKVNHLTLYTNALFNFYHSLKIKYHRFISLNEDEIIYGTI